MGTEAKIEWKRLAVRVRQENVTRPVFNKELGKMEIVTLAESFYDTEIKFEGELARTGKRRWMEDGLFVYWQVDDGKLIELRIQFDVGWVGTGCMTALRGQLKAIAGSDSLTGTGFDEELKSVLEHLE